jgi:N-acetylmuramoyl-L-alanine amidase
MPGRQPRKGRLFPPAVTIFSPPIPVISGQASGINIYNNESDVSLVLILLLLPPGFRRFLLALGALVLASLLAGAFSPSGLIRSLIAETGPVVVVDPGHGGVDGGTSDQEGTLEKDINLAIALRLRDHLRAGGVKVVMTRTTDTDLSPFRPGKSGRHRRDLAARIEKARNTRAVCLISIHCDWAGDKKRRGAVVFYNPRNNTGKELACAIQEELNRIQAVPQKAAPGNFFILNQSGLTAVLVEAGFLSHPEEARLLGTPVYQDRLARAIANGIRGYFQW